MLAIYIHYPFCQSKCPYCDFNSHVKDNIDYDAYLEAYESELEFFANNVRDKNVSSIFFGGGTPSLMPISLVVGILFKIYDIFIVADDVEISLEANPTSFESKKFRDLKKVGINRISLGIQSLNDDDLRFLGRKHDSKQAILAINEAANIFDNFSFDLIYARPGQTLEDWQLELQRAIDFSTSHLSLYQLSIEKGTKFYSDYKNKSFIMPDDELSADFYELTNDIVKDNGFVNYEISNYAKAGFQCRHNLSYWQGDDYIGIGPGAHGRVYLKQEKQRQATMMIHNPDNWLKKVKKDAVGIQKKHSLSQKDVLEELALTSLRLKTGLSLDILSKHFGVDITLDNLCDIDKLQRLQNQDLIYYDKEKIIIRDNNFIRANLIIAKVIECFDLNYTKSHLQY